MLRHYYTDFQGKIFQCIHLIESKNSICKRICKLTWPSKTIEWSHNLMSNKQKWTSIRAMLLRKLILPLRKKMVSSLAPHTVWRMTLTRPQVARKPCLIPHFRVKLTLKSYLLMVSSSSQVWIKMGLLESRLRTISLKKTVYIKTQTPNHPQPWPNNKIPPSQPPVSASTQTSKWTKSEPYKTNLQRVDLTQTSLSKK